MWQVAERFPFSPHLTFFFPNLLIALCEQRVDLCSLQIIYALTVLIFEFKSNFIS